MDDASSPGGTGFAVWATGAANEVAARAATAYLVGRGLAAEIDDVRAGEDTSPIAAPAFDDVVAELGAAAGEACHRGDQIAILLDDPAVDPGEIRAILALMQADADTVERAGRRLAQLLLGLSSQHSWSDAIARTERAAVVVLHAFDPQPVVLVDDGLDLRGRTDDELITELCGALCRMIIDHDCRLDLRLATGENAVRFQVDAVGNLVAVVRAPAGREDVLRELGWTVDDDGFGAAAWDDPVTVIEPAHLVIETLGRVHDRPMAGSLRARATASGRDSDG